MFLVSDNPPFSSISICSSVDKLFIASTSGISFVFKFKFTDSLSLYPLLLCLVDIFGSISNPLFSIYFITLSYLGLLFVIFLKISASCLASCYPFDK